MDSLTQIVLGAAAGEVVLGKKIGNRAMFWGAVGGTIPDLDVLGGIFLSNIDNLAFHRGISHSITFSIIGALSLGWLVHRLYQSSYHKWMAIVLKIIAAVLVGSAIQFVFRRFFPDNYVPIVLVGLGLIGILYYNIKKRYFTDQWEAPNASVRDWQWLFFWALFTHPILDCFTMYGTQLFAPFSDVRVSWSTISVADPLYTLPFLMGIIMASRFHRTSKMRRIWTYVGIGLSSAYMLFTVINKQLISARFAEAMKDQGIEYERFVTNPYILNNIVWSCTAETKDAYYLGQYSMFDETDIEFVTIAKNHHLIPDMDTDPTTQTLKWFSDGYFVVNEQAEGFQVSDLRFGTFSGKGDHPDDFIFRFHLTPIPEGGYYMEEAEGGPPEGTEDQMMGNLWKRIKGKKKDS